MSKHHAVPPPPPPPPPPPLPPLVQNDTGRRGRSNLPAWMSSQQQQQQKSHPPPPTTASHEYTEEEVAAVNSSLRTACQILEEVRCIESEREANVMLAVSLLQQHDVLTGGKSINCTGSKKTSKSNGKTDTTPTVDVSELPGGIQDAWIILSEASNTVGGGNPAWAGTDAGAGSATTMSNSTSLSSFKINYETRDSLPVGQGQVGKATATCTLKGCVDRISRIQNTLDGKLVDTSGDDGSSSQQTKRARDGTILKAAVEAAKALPLTSCSTSAGMTSAQSTADAAQRAKLWLTCLDNRLREIRHYNARHGSSIVATTAASTLPQIGTETTMTGPIHVVHNKRRRMGNPASDGYDLASSVVESLHGLLDADGMDVVQNYVATDDNQKYSVPESRSSAATISSTTIVPIAFSAEEVMGKYLDLQPVYDQHVVPIRNSVFGNASQNFKDGNGSFSFRSFLDLLSKGESGLIESVAETSKLQRDRKKYIRFLFALQNYLEGFLSRTQPLLDLQQELIDPAVQDFLNEWKEKGGYPPGWESKPAESVLAIAEQSKINGSDAASNSNTEVDEKFAHVDTGIDLSMYKTASDLEKAVDGDTLKAELSRLGLKCGGTVTDRANRLFLTKNTPLEKLPAKVFAKKPPKDQTSDSSTEPLGGDTNGVGVIGATQPTAFNFKNERRIDIARREVSIMALINQVKPTLEATIRRIERRETQTPREREKELLEDLYGSSIEGPKMKSGEGNDGNDDDDQSDDEDEVIYNPKGVPLDWDGKPMPYWLFKLHGLNHFYPCEICGSVSYRGRRAFELHFAESRHTLGMKTLGIPNTKHFHGVTKIEDAQNLWKKLQDQLHQSQFDSAKDEEYEDSHGRVLTRQAYEDLARQGLL